MKQLFEGPASYTARVHLVVKSSRPAQQSWGQTLCWGRQREGQCDVPAGYSLRSQHIWRPCWNFNLDTNLISCRDYLDCPGFQQLTLGEAILHSSLLENCLEAFSWSLALSTCQAHTCGITDTADLLCWGSPIDDTLGVSWHKMSEVEGSGYPA